MPMPGRVKTVPLLQAGLVYEGFAEWVAYQVLGFYGYRRGQQRMLARQDLYGAGPALGLG